MTQFLWVWHLALRLYYALALRHLSERDPLHPDLLRVLLSRNHHRDSERRFTCSPF